MTWFASSWTRVATSQWYGRFALPASMWLPFCEVSPRATDEEVVQLTFKDQRILVTEDKDFGQLVHASGQQRIGVLFARFPSTARRELPRAVLRVVRERGEKLMGSFVVVQPGRIRIAGRRAKA